MVWNFRPGWIKHNSRDRYSRSASLPSLSENLSIPTSFNPFSHPNAIPSNQRLPAKHRKISINNFINFFASQIAASFTQVPEKSWARILSSLTGIFYSNGIACLYNCSPLPSWADYGSGKGNVYASLHHGVLYKIDSTNAESLLLS